MAKTRVLMYAPMFLQMKVVAVALLLVLLLLLYGCGHTQPAPPAGHVWSLLDVAAHEPVTGGDVSLS